MRFIFAVLLVVGLFLTTFSSWLQEYFTGDVFLFIEFVDQFRLQVLVGFAILGILFLRKFSMVIIYTLLVCFNIHNMFFVGFHNQEAALNKQEISVITYNIWKDNPDQNKVVDFINQYDADVVWLQEIKIGHYYKAYEELKQKYPYFYPEPSKFPPQGKALISKYPFKVNKDLDSKHKQYDKSLHVTLNIKDQALDLFGVHFESPKSASKAYKRNKQIRSFFHYLVQSNVNQKYIILGDMNNVFWSRQFSPFYDHLHVQTYNKPLSLNETWPSYFFPFLRIPIDNIMISKNLYFESVEKLDPLGSDHIPLKAVIRY